MQEYYTSIFFIICFMMITVIVHLQENETLSMRRRIKLRNIAELISLGVVCEFVGFYLNNSVEVSKYVHGIIKATEFSISPIIAYSFLRLLMPIKSKAIKNIFIVFLVAHTVIEYLSTFIPITFIIDQNNVYLRGEFYYIYIIAYLISIVLCIIGLLNYCKRHQSRNILTISTMALFIIVGFSIRLIDNRLHTDWLVISIIYVIFIITYSDIYLKADSLTGVLNRRTYDNRLKSLNYSTVIIIFDINEFKSINDNYNHQCGDIILRVVAQDILKVYGKYGYCYRIGGDEFCVILKKGKLQEIVQKSEKFNISSFLNQLSNRLDDIIKIEVMRYPMLKEGISKGAAVYISNNDYDDIPFDDYCSTSIDEVIKIADERMYEEKKSSKCC
ncbi:MAG: GGDEF domain-containing protein [Clostridia bacterium]|nr:GGDEF domain-containing protein [Clostridia bacterium]